MAAALSTPALLFNPPPPLLVSLGGVDPQGGNDCWLGVDADAVAGGCLVDNRSELGPPSSAAVID